MIISDKIPFRKKALEYFDWTTFLITVLLVSVGLISLYSATFDSQMSSFFYKQLLSACIGLVAMFVLAFIPKRWIQINSITVYIGSIVLLLIVLFIGVEVYGTKGWISFAGFSLQPAEIAKFGIILMIARHLSSKGVDIRSIRDFAVVAVFLIIPIFLIIRQPDIGTATVLIAIFIGILYWSGFDLFTLYFVITLPIVILMSLKGNIYFVATVSILSIILFTFRKRIIVTLAAVAIYIGIGYASPHIYNNLMSHQKERIETFLNPGKNPRGSGYNVIQSILAVGSGGLSGKGFLQGSQTQLRYIPMQWSDFIFSVTAEEFGFLGSSLVVCLHLALIIRLINVASEINSKYYSIVAFSAASMFFYHVLINIGMAIGIIPVMGIPLPFMSYGGTSLLVNMSLIGLILNSYRDYKLKRAV